MIRAGCAVLVACMLAPAAAFAQNNAAPAAPGETRVIVTLRDSAALASYAAAFVADDRLQDSARFGYHSNAATVSAPGRSTAAR